MKKKEFYEKHIFFCFDLNKCKIDLKRDHLDDIIYKKRINNNVIEFINYIEDLSVVLSTIINDYSELPNRAHFDIISDVDIFIKNLITQYNKKNYLKCMILVRK